MLEVEAKFQIASPRVFDQIRSRKKVASFTLSNRANILQLDTYLDTTTRTLLRCGASFRLRWKAIGTSAVGEGIQLVTFKTPTSGIYTRTELEMPITDQQAQMLLSGNLEKIHNETIEGIVGHLKGAKIFPVLYVKNIRETWQINSNAGSIEFCLDDVRYANVEKTKSVHEYGVELELKNGEVVFLQQIADVLSQQYDLIPIFQSKYERGIVLLNGVAGNTEN